MLDHERRVLIEMEDHLRMADPAFVARMSAGTPRFPTLMVLWVVLAVTTPLMVGLAGATALTIATVVVLGLVATVMVRRSRAAAAG